MRREERDSVGTRSVYRLLVLIVMAIAAGRIATVTSREGNTAFLSANDRSRWCTVAALVEDGTYAIDRLIEIRDSRGRRPWQTIDKVRHRGRDGELHYYSSKPPLFPTLVAGLYAIVHVLTGMTLTDQPIYLTRILLALVNLPLLAVFLGSLLRVTHQLGDGDWSRRFLAAAVCFGTMLLPFTLALNNHLPAAASTALVVAIYVSAARRRHEAGSQQAWRPGGWVWFVAGLAAAFAAANELPALSMLALWVVLVFCLDRRGTAPLIAAAAVVVIAFFATNWIAHASLRPPYAHRGNGPAIAEFQPRENGSGEGPGQAVPSAVAKQLRERGLLSGEGSLELLPSSEDNRWLVKTSEDRLLALLRANAGSGGEPTAWVLAEWDDWYEYPGSYWQPGRREGVDRGEPSRLTYLFHMTFGHHGLFSLTPLWLLVPIGFVPAVWRSSSPLDTPGVRRLVAATGLATLVCVSFYVARPEIDRNYGGVSVCFRWLLWFAPLWLFAATAAANLLARSPGGKRLLGFLLLLSAFSVATALQTPWQHPWLYRFWAFLGWIDA